MYRYDAEQGIFVHEELSDIVFNQRLQVLRQKLVDLGSRDLTAEELHSIIYRGAFIYENNRYEYNADTGFYDQIQISDAEYQYRLQQLQQQLQTIGYEHMTLVECNSTIYTGAFYFNGYDWLYNYDTNVYDRSNVETTSKHRVDETEYSRVTTEPAEVTTEPTESVPKIKPTISPGRGDQPPEVYVAEYEEEEEPVEQEPGLGTYPVPVDSPIPTRVLEPSESIQQRKADITLQQQDLEEEQRIRIYEEQRLEHERQVREQEEQRLAYEEKQRLQEEQRRRDEEEARVQSEQRRLQEEQNQLEELERQIAERRAAEEAQQIEDQRRAEAMREEEERLLRQDADRRQAETDRKEHERREIEERQQINEEEEEGDGDQDEGDYEEEEEE